MNWGIMKILKPFFVSVFIRVNRPVRCVFPRDYDVRSTGKRHGTKAFYKVNTSPTWLYTCTLYQKIFIALLTISVIALYYINS